MVKLFQAVALDTLRALSELLPISTSGHLIMVPWPLGRDASLLDSLAFDAAVHLGTGLALLTFFWRDLAAYVAAAALLIDLLWWLLVPTVAAAGRRLVTEPIVHHSGYTTADGARDRLRWQPTGGVSRVI